jgi:predicted regulator of Ras-like GTPase activity (Roadblock/LC7/MglB family)
MRGVAQTKPKFAAYQATSNATPGNNSYQGWLMMCSAIPRMFGKISKFFRKSLGKQPEPFAAPAPAPMPERNPIGRPKFAVPGMEIPADNEASEAVEAVAAAPEYSQHTPDAISVPFRAILQLLPKELHGKSAASASGSYVLPTAVALEQLSRGAVKVALADLRRAAPSGFVASGGAHDNKMVDLPLREILNQLHPEAFARRSGQNRLIVPDEVTDLFGSKGERLTSVRVVDKSELKPTPRTPAGRAGATAPAETAGPEAAATPAQPIRMAPNLAQQLQGQVPSSPAGIPLTSFQKAAPAAPPAPGPSISAVPKVPAAPAGQLPKPGLSLPKPTPSLPAAQAPAAAPALPPNAIKFPTPPAPRPAAPQPAAAPAPAAAPSGGTLSVSINTVNQKWPESICEIISQIGATDLEIPNELIEPAVKSGRIEFPWEQLVTWLRPAPQGEVASEHGSLVIEMPLSVIAPLFLQQSKYKAKKSSVPGGIPDIFSSKGDKLAQFEPEVVEAEAEEEEVEEAEEEQEVEAEEQTTIIQATSIQAAPVAAPAVQVPAPFVPSALPAGRKAQSLNELFKEANKKNWTPNEIVHKTITLPGVTGALIALQDGLLVAGTMPAPWKTETIAAFIPQIFGRLTQYTKELQMGEVRTVSFGVDSGTLQIFNAGIIYFGALGQHGGSLPVEDLTLIATELSRHTK